MPDGVVSAFAAAGEWFVDIAGRDDVAARWHEPSALVGYTVGGVVGHAAAAAKISSGACRASPPPRRPSGQTTTLSSPVMMIVRSTSTNLGTSSITASHSGVPRAFSMPAAPSNPRTATPS